MPRVQFLESPEGWGDLRVGNRRRRCPNDRRSISPSGRASMPSAAISVQPQRWHDHRGVRHDPRAPRAKGDPNGSAACGADILTLVWGARGGSGGVLSASRRTAVPVRHRGARHAGLAGRGDIALDHGELQPRVVGPASSTSCAHGRRQLRAEPECKGCVVATGGRLITVISLVGDGGRCSVIRTPAPECSERQHGQV